MHSKELWSLPSGSGGGNTGGRQVMGSTNSYAYMTSGMQMQGGNGMPVVAPPHERSQEICKYFINGGCLRGAACPYLHELPDERHLDVNGLGFILNPNVHNAQKTVSVPQSNVGANSTVGQVSPTSTGSPLVMGLGGQPSINRQFQFGTGNNASGGKLVGAKANYNATANQTSTIPPAAMKPHSKYRPPEPYLEHNLPPVLALPLKTATPKEIANTLAQTLLLN